MKWNRHVSIKIGPISEKESTTGILIDGLRIDFEVSKSRETKSNRGVIKVYNARESTISQFFKKDYALYLYAGYSQSHGLLYSGDIENVEVIHDGTDKMVSIQCETGLSLIKRRKLSRSFESKTKKVDILDYILSEMEMIFDTKKLEIHDVCGESGYYLDGNAEDELKKLLNPIGYSFNIDDGQIQIIKEESDNVVKAVEIDVNTGLLEKLREKKEGEKELLKITSLLEWKVFSGSYVSLDKESYRVEKVKHKGSNRTDDFFSEMELERVE